MDCRSSATEGTQATDEVGTRCVVNCHCAPSQSSTPPAGRRHETRLKSPHASQMQRTIGWRQVKGAETAHATISAAPVNAAIAEIDAGKRQRPTG